MGKYRKKPDLVDAMQWDGENAWKVAEWVGQFDTPAELRIKGLRLFIVTGEGDTEVTPGSWVVRNKSGWLEVWAGVDFAFHYEPVEG